MFAYAQEALKRLGLVLAAADRTGVSEMHSTLGLTKAIRAKVDLVETTLAATVASSERHGDGGIEMLRQASGLTRSEAVRRVKTAKQLESLPAAREAVASGKLSLTNAHALVDAARKTAAGSVDADRALLQKAQEMPADDFARHSKAWVARRQDPSDLEAQHRRNYKNRHLRFWSDSNGAINMRGSFDAEMGSRIRGHIQHVSEKQRLDDRRRLRKNRRHPQRNEAQRNSDALDRIITNSLNTSFSDTAGAAGLDIEVDRGGRGGSTSMIEVDRENVVDSDTDPASETDNLVSCSDAVHKTSVSDSKGLGAHGGYGMGHIGKSVTTKTGAEIIVRADLAALSGEPGGLAELVGAGPIPQSSLERLTCNSAISAVLFAGGVKPVYEARTQRAPSVAQRRALIARDGACIGCGADPRDCEAHHIVPWRQCKQTQIDNLVLVCWACHDRIHQFHWQVIQRNDRYTLQPPTRPSQTSGSKHHPDPTCVPDMTLDSEVPHISKQVQATATQSHLKFPSSARPEDPMTLKLFANPSKPTSRTRLPG